MKDKRNYLKVASILEIVYIFSMLIYYVFFTKFSDSVIANGFLLIIDLFLTIVLYKESKKEIKNINKTYVLFISIWFFLEPVITGVLGFMFLSSIKEKKKVILPEIKKENSTVIDYIKAGILIINFMLLMFILPNFSFYEKIPSWIIYVLIILFIFVVYFKTLKEQFIIFIKNIKVYLPFVIKRYFIMLGVMLVVAVPIVLINNGNTSANQQMLNSMFKKLPILMLLLSTLYAPFAEECIFRLSLSKLLKNKTLFIIISGFLFGALHVIDKFTSFEDFLYIFQYSALGICLAKAYADTNNIFVSISMHFIQNFLAAILVLLLY